MTIKIQQNALLRLCKRIRMTVIENDRKAHALIAEMARRRATPDISNALTLFAPSPQSESRCQSGNSEQGALSAEKGERKDGMECHQNEL